MKKLLLIGVIALAAAAAFAQDAPKEAPKNWEIYGATQFDYTMSGYELGLASPVWSNFTFAKLRLGLRGQVADGLKTYFELDPRNLEFRLAYIDWTAAPNLTLSAGKYNTLFAQVNGWLFASRKTGVGAKYAMPGVGWAGLMVGNDADISFTSGGKLSYPTTTKTVYEISVANPTDIKVYPAIAWKPDFGKEIALEIGANSEMNVTKMLNATPSGLSVDGYVKASAFGFDFAAEYTFASINAAAASSQNQTLFAQITYNAGFVAPTAYIVWDNIAGSYTGTGYNATPNMTIAVELPFKINGSLKINPMFSYALSGYNVNQFINANDIGVVPANDWTAGIRVDYSYSAKF